jgi:hypothetical protein
MCPSWGNAYRLGHWSAFSLATGVLEAVSMSQGVGFCVWGTSECAPSVSLAVGVKGSSSSGPGVCSWATVLPVRMCVDRDMPNKHHVCVSHFGSQCCSQQSLFEALATNSPCCCMVRCGAWAGVFFGLLASSGHLSKDFVFSWSLDSGATKQQDVCAEAAGCDVCVGAGSRQAGTTWVCFSCRLSYDVHSSAKGAQASHQAALHFPDTAPCFFCCKADRRLVGLIRRPSACNRAAAGTSALGAHEHVAITQTHIPAESLQAPLSSALIMNRLI